MAWYRVMTLFLLLSLNKKSKMRSDFEDEDSELFAELGLLREANKKPRR